MSRGLGDVYKRQKLEDATAVGWVALFKLRSVDRDDLQIGYEFAPAHWGKGFATEAAGRLVQYSFEELEFDRVAALVRPRNTASVNVLRKLGFVHIDRRQDYTRRWCNEYRLTVEAWRQRMRSELLGPETGSVGIA